MTSSDTYELHAICAVGNFDKLQEMLASGKYDNQINQKDEEWGGRTPLQWCCIKGRGDMVRYLLEKGAHPGLRSNTGWTAVHFAAECGRTHILRTLHQFNAPMDRKDFSGDGPHDIARIYNHKEAVEFLNVARQDYATKRRKQELSGQVTQFDDEDIDWCNEYDVKPTSYITEDELRELNERNSAAKINTPTASTRRKSNMKKSVNDQKEKSPLVKKRNKNKTSRPNSRLRKSKNVP